MPNAQDKLFSDEEVFGQPQSQPKLFSDEDVFGSPERGFLGNVKGLAIGGAKRLAAGMPLADDVATGQFGDKAAGQMAKGLNMPDDKPEELRQVFEAFEPYTEKWKEANGFIESAGVIGSMAGAIGKEAVTNPKGLAYATAEQAANMVPSMAGMYAGGKLGGVAGTAIAPGIGTAIGTVVGALGGAFAGGWSTEAGLEATGYVGEELSKRGLEPTEENIKALLQDESVREGAIDVARKKATGTAATDAALTLLGGRVATAPGRAAQKAAIAELGAGATREAIEAATKANLKSVPMLNRAGYGLAGGAIDIAGEGISEAVGQKWATGELDMADIAHETFAGVGGAAPSVFTAGRALATRPGQEAVPEQTPPLPSGPLTKAADMLARNTPGLMRQSWEPATVPVPEDTLSGEWNAQQQYNQQYNQQRNVKTTQRTLSPEEAAFMRAYNNEDDTPENRAAWAGRKPATVAEIEDRKMQADWDQQEQSAAANLAGRFPKKREVAPTQEKADPLAAQKAAFDESYDAAGTTPASEGNISKEDADKFEAKATQERKAKQHREWLAGHKKKMADVEATLKDKAVPVEVLKAAQAEADKIVATDPVYQHMEEAKKRGKINLDAMRQTYGKEMTRQITQRYPGIFSLVGTVNPDEFAQEMGYGKADEMINRFSEARTKKELAAQFVKEKVGEWEQAQSDQDDYFTGMAERQQGAEEWVGPQSATKPLRTVFPAPDEAVTAMESMIRRKPENFTEDDLDHWTYTAEQQGRLRQAYREATDGQREVPGDTQASPGESKPEGRTEPVAEVDQEAAGLDTLPATPEQGVAAPAGDKSTPIDTAVDTAATGTQVLSGQVTSDNTEQVQQNEGGVAQSATTVTPQGGVADETGETQNNQADDYTQAQLKQLLADLKEKRKQQGTVTDDRLEKQIRDIEKLIEGEAAEVVSSEMEPATPTVKESLTVDPQDNIAGVSVQKHVAHADNTSC